MHLKLSPQKGEGKWSTIYHLSLVISWGLLLRKCISGQQGPPAVSAGKVGLQCQRKAWDKLCRCCWLEGRLNCTPLASSVRLWTRYCQQFLTEKPWKSSVEDGRAFISLNSWMTMWNPTSILQVGFYRARNKIVCVEEWRLAGGLCVTAANINTYRILFWLCKSRRIKEKYFI